MIKFLKKILTLIFIVVIFVGGFFIYQGYDLYKKAIVETSIEDKIKEIKKEKENYVKIEELPEDYINAIVAVEDRRFYKHNGIDLISISRAIITDIKTMSLVEGGSTITQQLAKNTYFTQSKDVTRKIAEMFMAFEFERVCSKDEILELYVNTIYFGARYYCI